MLSNRYGNMRGGDLFDQIGKRVDMKGYHDEARPVYSEPDARYLFVVFVEDVHFCHEDKCIAHCELKSRDLLPQVSSNLHETVPARTSMRAVWVSPPALPLLKSEATHKPPKRSPPLWFVKQRND